MSSAATRCCTPSPSVARDLVHIQRSQYERYSLAVTSDGKVGPSGVVLRPLSHSKCDNVKQLLIPVSNSQLKTVHTPC